MELGGIKNENQEEEMRNEIGRINNLSTNYQASLLKRIEESRIGQDRIESRIESRVEENRTNTSESMMARGTIKNQEKRTKRSRKRSTTITPNSKDLLLISHFRKNSRETLTKISRKTGVPISTLFDRLKMYEGSIINKHTALLDFQKIGYSARANLMIRVDPEQRQDVKNRLLKHDNVNSLYKINNGYDFLAELVFPSIIELEEFIDGLEEEFKIKDKAVFYLVEEIAREKFLSDPELVKITMNKN